LFKVLTDYYASTKYNLERIHSFWHGGPSDITLSMVVHPRCWPVEQRKQKINA